MMDPPEEVTADTQSAGEVEDPAAKTTDSQSAGGDTSLIVTQTNVIETPANNKTQAAKPKKPASSGKKKGKQSKGPSLEEVKRRGRASRQNPQKENVQILTKMANLSLKSTMLSNLGTGLIYDHFMTQHRNEWDPKHPECPERITEPYLRCLQYGLVTRCVPILPKMAAEDAVLSQHSGEHLKVLCESVSMTGVQPLKELSEKYHGIYMNNPQMAADDTVLSQNSPEHLELLKDLCRFQTLQGLSEKYDSVYFNSKTYECAQMSLGSTIELTEQILQEKVRNGFAIVRPPGHHAMYNEACGYCFFNNVAIAAKHALDKFGLQRILIVDWDVHHGQGTQYMFYDDPRVMYVSIHRYEYGNFWPNLRESDYDFVGEGKGAGYNINIPLNKIGMNNSDYMAIFQQVLMPIFYEYNPQLVLISSGYDAAIGCPEGEMEVTPACYAHFINLLSTLANGKLAVILEGGYCLKTLSEGVALTLRALLGDPTPRIEPLQQPNETIRKTILNAITVLRPYWKCLQYQGVLPVQSSDVSSTVQEEENLRTVPFSTPENRPSVFPIDELHYPVQEPALKAALMTRIQGIIDNTYLGKASHRTSLVYDEAMRKHKNHVDPGHPERPDRITKIYNKIDEYELLGHCLRIESRMATSEELLLCHQQEHMGKMQQTKDTKPRELKDVQLQYNSIYLCQESYDCAKLAVGSLLNVVEAVLTNKSQNGVAIIRPPGHHAEVNQACGFCLFNNAAIAARYAQKTFGIKKVLILDWDVHHGNGTQHIFEEDPSVLYISIHRYDHGFFFPPGPDGNYDRVGKGAGTGFNINVAWNKYGMGDSEYIAAFHQVVMPVAYEFDPDLVLISAGFDAARGDPLGGCDITPACYGHMTQMLMGLANGRVVVALEGGYNLHSISESMAMCTKVLLGGTCPPLPPVVPKESAVDAICKVLDTHKQYWKCLQFRVDLPAPVVTVTSDIQSSDVSSTTDIDTLTSAIGSMQVKSESVSSSSDGGSFVCSPKSTVTGSDSAGESPLGGACGGSDIKNLTVRELIGGSLADQDDLQMFAVVPLSWCEHLGMVAPLSERGLDVHAACSMCESTRENWVCLTCYEVCCGRYVNEHMLYHGLSTEHKMVLSYSDLSVWCYGCDAYVHNEILFPAKRAAHLSKFGEDIPGLI